jgi:hypothetical protein
MSGEPNLRETRYVLASGRNRARFMWEGRRRKSTLTYLSKSNFWLATKNGEIIEENGGGEKRN